MKVKAVLPAPQPKQADFIKDVSHKFLAYGGARGGGKSWAVRLKCTILALKYAGIRQLIVRRTYPELYNNHILPLRKLLTAANLMPSFVKFHDGRKEFNFKNGSLIKLMYCDADRDVLMYQGTEWDVIYLDEATQLKPEWIDAIKATMRGTGAYPRQMNLTCNPGGAAHPYVKRLFIDRRYERGEDEKDYRFIASTVFDNKALMTAEPGYVDILNSLPERLRQMWLFGRWDIYEGMFFEDFRTEPDLHRCAELGISPEQARKEGLFTHVIEPLPLNVVRSMKIYRSYDFGYNRPFSVAWWGVDSDGVMYRLLEWYGCEGEPNRGVRLPPKEQFSKIRKLENEHEYLKGQLITGVADPSIWDASRGESIYESACREGVYFSKGDNRRVAGWMQCHYRLAFDENGRALCYVFKNCRDFIRTIPQLAVSKTKPEDLDTEGEDHIADEWRYMCMARPIPARRSKPDIERKKSPLDDFAPQYTAKRWEDYYD